MVMLGALKLVRGPRGGGGPALIAIALICSAQLMIVIDGTIVNVAIPSITQHLRLSAGGPTWIVNAYTLVFGGCLMLGGRAADLLGRRPVFCAGIALFTAGSVVCGLAVAEPQLIAGRAVQGLGTALASWPPPGWRSWPISPPRPRSDPPRRTDRRPVHPARLTRLASRPTSRRAVNLNSATRVPVRLPINRHIV
jgi:hypothetical protein